MVLDSRGLDRGIPILLTWLSREGVIPADAVPRVLDAMAEQAVSVEEAVVGLTAVTDREIAQRYAGYFHVPQAEEGAVPDPTLAQVLPAGFCREHLMAPLSRTRHGIVIAMVDPSRLWLHAQITMMTGLELDVRVAPLSRVARWIDDLHGSAARPTGPVSKPPSTSTPTPTSPPPAAGPSA